VVVTHNARLASRLGRSVTLVDGKIAWPEPRTDLAKSG
jgi:predicted ABC-type transport system involved in lysophospholipase L1 biosynthesis ATPase subunit